MPKKIKLFIPQVFTCEKVVRSVSTVPRSPSSVPSLLYFKNVFFLNLLHCSLIIFSNFKSDVLTVENISIRTHPGSHLFVWWVFFFGGRGHLEQVIVDMNKDNGVRQTSV